MISSASNSNITSGVVVVAAIIIVIIFRLGVYLSHFLPRVMAIKSPEKRKLYSTKRYLEAFSLSPYLFSEDSLSRLDMLFRFSREKRQKTAAMTTKRSSSLICSLFFGVSGLTLFAIRNDLFQDRSKHRTVILHFQSEKENA